MRIVCPRQRSQYRLQRRVLSKASIIRIQKSHFLFDLLTHSFAGSVTEMPFHDGSRRSFIVPQAIDCWRYRPVPQVPNGAVPPAPTVPAGFPDSRAPHAPSIRGWCRFPGAHPALPTHPLSLPSTPAAGAPGHPPILPPLPLFCTTEHRTENGEDDGLHVGHCTPTHLLSPRQHPH